MNAPGVVHVACGEVAALLATAPAPAGWLSPTESHRLSRLKSARRRDAFVAARWQARWLLAQAFGGAPADWALEAPTDAPPRVAGRRDLFLSTSHSGSLVATAVATGPVGIDLEVPRPGRDIGGLRELCCTAPEQVLFEGLDADAAAPLFHELWTVKEAWLKRRHDWLAPSRLRQIDVAPGDGGEIRTWRGAQWQLALCTDAGSVRWWSPAPDGGRRWVVRADRGATQA